MTSDNELVELLLVLLALNIDIGPPLDLPLKLTTELGLKLLNKHKI